MRHIRLMMMLFLLILYNLCYLRHEVIEVSGTKDFEDIEVAASDIVEHVILLYHRLLHSRLDVVEDKFAGHPWYRLLTCRIDICQDHLIEVAQRRGEVLVEVTGTGIEMWLEHNRNLPVRINLAKALRAHENFLRMMAVVGEEHVTRIADLEVETTVHALVSLHSVAYLIGRATVELCHCHCGNSVLDIDWNGLSELDILDILYRRDEVEDDFSILDADILCMEVAFIAAVGVSAHTLLHVWLHLQSRVDYQRSTRLYELRIMTEALQVSLLCPVDIEVIRSVAVITLIHGRSQWNERSNSSASMTT